eukprot:gene5985-8242_t
MSRLFGGLFKKDSNTVNGTSSDSFHSAQSIGSIGSQHSVTTIVENGSGNDLPDNSSIIELDVEIGGGKGWPIDVQCVLYHNVQGLICVGTEGGAVFVYGDGFQFVRPWLTDDPNPVVSILPLHPDRILVVFGNNSVVVMSLPSLEIIDLLEPTWMGGGSNNRNGDITAVHVDFPSEKNYAYFGTSEGMMFVLDIQFSSIRVVDYNLSLSDVSITESMSLTAIQISPKDEKYIALGFEGSNNKSGAIVIFDLQKRKVYRSYKTNAISSIYWHHLGEILYAGTKNGELYQALLDKSSCNEIWNSTNERNDSGRIDDEDGEDDINTSSSAMPEIKRIKWLAPQPPSQEGCLFIQLVNNGPDNDELNNVIIGLSPLGLHGEMELVFALPPIPNEKLVGFRVVPSYERTLGKEHNTNNTTVVPALLLLCQKQDEIDRGKYYRYLNLLRCPKSSVGEWRLEIGTLPDPRRAIEVLPAISEVTFITGFLPSGNPNSLAAVFLSQIGEDDSLIQSASAIELSARQSAANIEQTEDYNTNTPNNNKKQNSRRLSARDFSLNLINLDDLEITYDNWEMVLATGSHNVNTPNNRPRIQDIIMKGHSNGTVIVWGVSLPERGKEFGKGNIWLPLQAFKCGSSQITSIGYDESGGLFAIADENGVLVIMEIFDEYSNTGACDIVRKLFDKAIEESYSNNNSNSNQSIKYGSSFKLTQPDKMSDDDNGHGDGDSSIYNEEQGHEEEYIYKPQQDMIFANYNPHSFREVLRTRLHDCITAILLISIYSTIFVGTEDGTIYACKELKSGLFCAIEKVDKLNNSGAVLNFSFAYFNLFEELIPAIYVFFSNGNLAVIELNSLSIIAYCLNSASGGIAAAETATKKNNNQGYHNNNGMFILNSSYFQVSTPSLGSVGGTSGGTAIGGIGTLDSRYSSHSIASTHSIDSINSLLSTPNSPASSINQLSHTGSSVVDSPSSTSGLPPPVATKKKTGFLSGFGRTDTDDVKSSSSQQMRNSPNIMNDNENIPRYVVLVKGKVLFTYDISKFAILVKRGSKQFSSNNNPLSIKNIAQRNIRYCQFFIYFPSEEYLADPNHAVQVGVNNPIPCLTGINEDGDFVIISIKQKNVVNSFYMLEGIINDTIRIDLATILPNGNCYMSQNSCMFYTTTSISTTHQLSDKYLLPDRAIPEATAPDKTLLLCHGREQLISNQRATLNKRRKTVISFSGTPTDLNKIFAKSRDQRARDELLDAKGNNYYLIIIEMRYVLFAMWSEDEDEDDGRISKTSSSANALRTTSSTTAAEMNLTKQAFEERGEKLNRMEQKMNNFKSSAQQFSETMAETNANLRRKSTRWGLF